MSNDPARRTRHAAAAPGACLAAWLAASLAGCGTARAQLIQQYFQPGVPGFGEERGVPVMARPRPLYAPPELSIAGLSVRADLDESLLYNSNVDGQSGGPGSWVVRTAPSLAVDANGRRGKVGAAVSLEDERYLDTPAQNRTNWTASLGGSYALGHDTATLGYGHFDEHEVSSTLGAIASTTAIPVKADDLRGSYAINLGRLSFTPSVEEQFTRYGMATMNGQTLDDSVLDSDVLTAGVTTRYDVDESRSLFLVVQGVDSSYVHVPKGQVDASSRSVIVLGGLDYQSNGVFRYRLLAGFENRSFASSVFPTTTTPVVEAGVIWLPTGLTTLSASLSRRIEESTAVGIGSYTYTAAELVVDHELRRNVILEGRTDLQFAEYASGGSQNSIAAGAGVTWLLNPRARLSADYLYTHQSALSGSATRPVAGPAAALAAQITGQYDQSVITLKLHLSL